MFAIASLTTSPTSQAAASPSPHSMQNASHARRTVAKLAGSLVTFNRSGRGCAPRRGACGADCVADVVADCVADSTCGRCCPLARWAMVASPASRARLAGPSPAVLPVVPRVGGDFAARVRRPRLQPLLPLLHRRPAPLVVGEVVVPEPLAGDAVYAVNRVEPDRRIVAAQVRDQLSDGVAVLVRGGLLDRRDLHRLVRGANEQRTV